MSRRKRRGPLPPMDGPRQLFGVSINSYSVGSWCPTTDGTGPAEAVAIELDTHINGQNIPMIMRLKSPQAVDTMIQALLRHKRDVWPDAS